MQKFYYFLPSPIGNLLLLSNGKHLTGLYCENQKYFPQNLTDYKEDKTSFKIIIEQLDAYFAGYLKDFSFSLIAHGTAFQKEIWQELASIPYGSTASYKNVANKLKRPNSVRAVANAIGKNPISVIIPCHRVIGSNGDLTGYAGGITIKKWLLDHEKNSLS